MQFRTNLFYVRPQRDALLRHDIELSQRAGSLQSNNSSEIKQYIIPDFFRFFFYLSFSIGAWMFLSASTCFALNYLTEFNSIVTSFVIFLGCCSSANIMMAVAVNLFPTNYRGMATSFILMFGRIGGFAGSNLVGILLAGMCPTIFYLNGALLISKFRRCFDFLDSVTQLY